MLKRQLVMPNVFPNQSIPNAMAKLLCLAAITSMLLGCGPSGPAYWPISGRVTFQGKPVSVGLIRFCNSAAGIDIVESLDADGRYVIVTGTRKGLPQGEYRVAVAPKLDFSRVKYSETGLPLPSTLPSDLERNPPNIPAKYHDPATSGLTATVKPSSNTFDFDMQPGH